MYNPNKDGKPNWGDTDLTIPVIGTRDTGSDMEQWDNYSLQKWGIMLEGMPSADRERYRQHIPVEWWPVLLDRAL